MSPQVKASIKLAIPLLMAAIASAAIPILIDLGNELAAVSTGSTAAILVVAVRVLQGYNDQKREERGEVNDADVGAYLPPKGSAPLEELRQSRFRDTTDQPSNTQYEHLDRQALEDLEEGEDAELEVAEDFIPDPLGRNRPPMIQTRVDERIPPGIGIITGISNPDIRVT